MHKILELIHHMTSKFEISGFSTYWVKTYLNNLIVYESIPQENLKTKL